MRNVNFGRGGGTPPGQPAGRRRALGIIALAAFLAFGVAQADELLERRIAELELVAERRRIPPATDASVAELETYIREKAVKAEVAVTIAPAPASRLSPLLEWRRLDVSGSATLADAQIFLAFAGNVRGVRLADFESVQLVPRPDDRVGFRVRVAMLCWVDGPLGDPRTTLAEIRALDERLEPARFVSAIGDLEHAIRGEAIALTEFRGGEETQISGVLLGAKARQALRPALETSGFAVRALDVTPRGDCQAFTVTARLTTPRPERVTWADANIFDGDTASVCTPKPAAAARRIAARGSGGWSLHLRGADVPALFLALNGASKEGFVISPAVIGRYDVDLDGVTTAEAVAALNAAGIAVGPGPLHLVGSTAAAPAAEDKGEPIEFSVRAAALNDVVRVFEQISGRKLGASSPALRVSIYSSGDPWDRVYAAAKLMAAETKPEPSHREWWDRRALADWTAGDLTLAGVAQTAEGWMAFVHPLGPGRWLWTLRPADAVRDAKVAAIDANGVAFDNGVKLPVR